MLSFFNANIAAKSANTFTSLSRHFSKMSAPNIVPLNEDKATIEAKIKETKGLVLVDFSAPWCPDCRRLTAGLPGVANKHPDVTIYTCDVDKVPNAREDWGIQHIPDVRFFKNGETTSLASIVEGSAVQVDAKINELK